MITTQLTNAELAKKLLEARDLVESPAWRAVLKVAADRLQAASAPPANQPRRMRPVDPRK